MSHAIRNSLILLIVLLLFVSASWGYIEYYQIPERQQLKQQLNSKQQKLKTDQQIADQYNALHTTYQEASKYFNNYNKTLYRTSDEDNVYDFLNLLNRGPAYINFNFSFKDSTLYPKYGVLNMEITGDGRYRNLVNFVHEIELSKPLNKIKNVSITPAKDEESNDMVAYSFNLESYYDRSKILEKPSYEIYNSNYISLHNPFFPLIRNIKPNEAGRINISDSRLVALSTERIFVVDQNGVMQQLRIGDKVYLGKLSGINLDKKSATFTLNEGGIVRHKTLEVQHENQ